jgi:hypothetical protein
MDGLLRELDWRGARSIYDRRVAIHQTLLRLHDNGEMREFSDLLLGVTDRDANYSASHHGLGPRIRANNDGVDRRVFQLGSELRQLTDGHQVPQIVRNAGLSSLGIGVGSEGSCLLNPAVCWVTNVRTIWADLALSHGGNPNAANEQLSLYRDHLDSDMAYEIWVELHARVRGSLLELVRRAAPYAEQNGIVVGELTFLWADAIANGLYEQRTIH